MGRGSTQILIRKIMETLSKSPKSSSEIAEETGLDRTSIARYLDILKESGFVVEEQQGTSKKYIISSNYQLDTYFGLSLDHETNKLIDSLYSLIQKKWKEVTGRKLLKTTAQKIIYQVIEYCKLKIPHGWYIFGGICVKPFDYNKTYDFTGATDHIITCVHETVVEYSNTNFEYESKQLQYKKAGKELYDTKEDILKLLYSKNFSKKSMFVFQKFFTKFWREAPIKEDYYSDILNDYDTLIIDITKEWDNFIDEHNERNFAEFKQKLITSFEAIWKLVAMINFKRDLFQGEFYLQKELDEHFKFDLNQAKDDIIEICSELNDMVPFENPDTEVYGQIKDIREKASQIPKRTIKEQEQINKEMDEYQEKHGLEELGKKLRKDFGL